MKHSWKVLSLAAIALIAFSGIATANTLTDKAQTKTSTAINLTTAPTDIGAQVATQANINQAVAQQAIVEELSNYEAIAKQATVNDVGTVTQNWAKATTDRTWNALGMANKDVGTAGVVSISYKPAVMGFVRGAQVQLNR